MWNAATAATIVVAIITGVLGASGIINVVVAYLVKPDIFAEVIPTTKSPHVATINVKNNGNAPARDLDLTVTTSSNITNHHIFSTENYTEINNTKHPNPKMLKIHIPRFVEGEGSLVTIDAMTNPKPNNASEDYNVYTTHDVGSSKLVTHIVSQFPQNPSITIDKQTTTLESKYGYGLIYIIVAVIIVVIYILVSHRYKNKKTQLAH